MTSGINYYKIKTIKKLVEKTTASRNLLLQELTDNGTDPTIVKRRLRMLQHLNDYETQLISKIQQFETDNVDDLNCFNLDPGIQAVIHRSA
jgi:hypothetical protein